MFISQMGSRRVHEQYIEYVIAVGIGAYFNYTDISRLNNI